MNEVKPLSQKILEHPGIVLVFDMIEANKRMAAMSLKLRNLTSHSTGINFHSIRVDSKDYHSKLYFDGSITGEGAHRHFNYNGPTSESIKGLLESTLEIEALELKFDVLQECIRQETLFQDELVKLGTTDFNFRSDLKDELIILGYPGQSEVPFMQVNKVFATMPESVLTDESLELYYELCGVGDGNNSTKPKGKLEILNRDQMEEIFNKASMDLLGMTGEEFRQKYEAGEIDVNGEDHGNIIRVIMLMPDNS